MTPVRCNQLLDVGVDGLNQRPTDATGPGPTGTGLRLGRDLVETALAATRSSASYRVGLLLGAHLALHGSL